MNLLNFDVITNLMESEQFKSIIIQLIIIFLGAILIDIFQRKVVKKINTKLTKKTNQYIVLVSLLKTIKFPISAIIYILATTVSLSLINIYAHIEIINKIKSLRGILILLIIGYFLISFIKEIKTRKVEEIDIKKTGKDKTVIQITANISNVFIFIIFTLMILQEIGVSVSGLMAFGGIGGLIVGLSAKELLSDFLGGIILITDKPFKVGDWIRSPDRDIEGVVEEIGMRKICVRTFDKRPLYIPNSILSTITIENPSRMTNRRIKETIGIRYQDADKMSSITRKVKKMLEEHSAIDTNQILMVNFDSFADSSLDFFIYTFTKTTDWQTYHGIKHDVLLNVYRIIKEEGAEIAYPTTQVYMDKKIFDKNLI